MSDPLDHGDPDDPDDREDRDRGEGSFEPLTYARRRTSARTSRTSAACGGSSASRA